LIAFAAWRLSRYLKLGMTKRSAGVVSGAGMLVQTTTAAGEAGEKQPPGSSPASQRVRPLGALAGLAFWLLCNVLIVSVLFWLPLLQDAPPLILMVAAVLPNFYLIRFARRLAEQWSDRTAR
jgi:hypothetical protein